VIATKAELEVLQPIAKPVANQKRASVAKVRAVVLELCQRRYLTADQIADLCNREVEGLRDRILTKLVKEGALLHRYPDQPNRPDQAYTAADEAS
jgi:ATP-dependent DNA helicase RecG